MRVMHVVRTKPRQDAVELFGSAATLNRVAACLPWYRRNVERVVGQTVAFDGVDFDALSFDKGVHQYCIHWVVPNGRNDVMVLHGGRGCRSRRQ